MICKTTQIGWNPFTITAIDVHSNSKFILHSRKENPQSIKIKPNKPKLIKRPSKLLQTQENSYRIILERRNKVLILRKILHQHFHNNLREKKVISINGEFKLTTNYLEFVVKVCGWNNYFNSVIRKINLGLISIIYSNIIKIEVTFVWPHNIVTKLLRSQNYSVIPKKGIHNHKNAYKSPATELHN